MTKFVTMSSSIRDILLGQHGRIPPNALRWFETAIQYYCAMNGNAFCYEGNAISIVEPLTMILLFAVSIIDSIRFTDTLLVRALLRTKLIAWSGKLLENG